MRKIYAGIFGLPERMARDVAVLDDDESPLTYANTTDSGGNDGLLGRRRYLQTVAAGLLTGAAAAAAGTGAASDDDYDVLTVGAGQNEVIEVDSGETLENLLIDCTATGADVTIAAHGTDWTVRNVGIEGRVAGSGAIFGVSDRAGNTSRMENVYIGDGAARGHRQGLGIWVAPQHSGHIDIDRVNIQEMGDNSFYCSAPMHSGAGGTVDISNCYSRDSWVAHYRLGEGTVSNCTAVNTSDADDGRGIWAWAPGDVVIEDCNLAVGGRHYSIVAGANGRGSNVRVRDTEYDTGFNGGFRRPSGGNIELESGNGTDPADVVPDGCPTEAAEAATGTDAASSTALPNVIVFDGREADSSTTEYEFTVSGAVEPSTDEDATIDAAADVDGNTASGVVANYLDAFRFDGRLESMSVDGDAAVRVNGVTVESTADDPDSSAPVRPISGSGSATR